MELTGVRRTTTATVELFGDELYLLNRLLHSDIRLGKDGPTEEQLSQMRDAVNLLYTAMCSRFED